MEINEHVYILWNNYFYIFFKNVFSFYYIRFHTNFFLLPQ